MSDMDSDKEKKEKAKLEKKRLKAMVKAEKARAKVAQGQATEAKEDEVPSGNSEKAGIKAAKSPGKPKETQESSPSQPPPITINIPLEIWWKDPRWISAIIGAISLSLALIYYFTDII